MWRGGGGSISGGNPASQQASAAAYGCNGVIMAYQALNVVVHYAGVSIIGGSNGRKRRSMAAISRANMTGGNVTIQQAASSMTA